MACTRDVYDGTRCPGSINTILYVHSITRSTTDVQQSSQVFQRRQPREPALEQTRELVGGEITANPIQSGKHGRRGSI